MAREKALEVHKGNMGYYNWNVDEETFTEFVSFSHTLWDWTYDPCMGGRKPLNTRKERALLEGGIAWYLVVLGRKKAVLVGTWWY